MAKRNPRRAPATQTAKAYDHKEQPAVLRPDIGLQAQFKKKKEPAAYRYDPSLDPQLSWDINADREHAEALIAQIEKEVSSFQFQVSGNAPTEAEWQRLLDELQTRKSKLEALARELRRMSAPFLNWAGKAERHTFTVPTLPLFVHERLSTEAILKSVQTHKQQLDLFADPKLDLAERVLRAYEHQTGWVNRLILGDSLVVMNSLLKYEGLGGQVQCIYVDPPYGVKFGSNFQPFIRKRDVKHNDDTDFTREPEIVQAYRDTWELGLHSYLTYLRDRFLLCRELLAPSGSIFVQISTENVHHVREILDEVFGAENFQGHIVFVKKTGKAGGGLDTIYDVILWYAKDHERVKFHKLFVERKASTIDETYSLLETNDGEIVRLSKAQLRGEEPIPAGRRLQAGSLYSDSGGEKSRFEFEFDGKTYHPLPGYFWRTNPEGMQSLTKAGRLMVVGNWLRYKQYVDDFPYTPINTLWDDTRTGGFASDALYVVQTATKVIARCILMTTDPGDLVLDPTCGSGTTAYVAEQWGRRWITIDTSRVPLALARQRLLTATFPYYELRDEKAGPAGGFVYRRRQNAKGEEIGGIVPHITLKSIANNEPPEEEVLVDRPEVVNGVVRVTGPFVVEATIPTPVDFEGDGVEDSRAKTPEEIQGHIERMLEALRRSPVLRLPNNQTVSFKNVRQPAKTMSLHAEAEQQLSVASAPLSDGSGQLTKGKQDEPDVSRPVGVAKGNAVGGGGLQGQSEVSPGGNLRPDEPTAPGGGVNPQQHRRGAGPEGAEAVSTVSGSSAGFAAGTGNASADLAKPGLPAAGGGGAASPADGGSGSHDQRPDELSALTTGNRQPTTALVAFVFGPENGAVSEQLVFQAAREAYAKSYQHLYVIGFAIQDAATKLIQNCEAVVGIPATYVAATMDLQMHDLLKTTRASQIFSVTGAPEIKLTKLAKQSDDGEELYQVELLGLDVFDPVTMETTHKRGDDVPAWFLDTDYNELAFCVAQAFFPRTAAWDNLKRSLRGVYADSVWEHLAGTVSEPFAAGERRQIAVKVIDDRGNELLVVKKLSEAEERR